MDFNEKEIYSKAISKKLGIPLLISKLLYNRNIKTEDDIYQFFVNDELDNPFLIPNLKIAVDRILKAIDDDEKIIVYGDYDVDGLMSSSILYLYLKKINANVDIFIPKREDGYGLNKNSIKKLYEEKEASLIVTVDTGTTAKGIDLYCKELNIDLIITDHHEVIDDKLPNESYAIINPKLIEQEHDLRYLSGSGISYFIVRALNSKVKKKENLINYKVLSAIATISDMVPLIGNNRIIVKEGISLLYETDIAGLNILLDSMNFFDYPNANNLAFNLIPILNSAARMNQSDVTLNLLTENNLLSYAHAESLKKINIKRKEESNKMYEVAFNIVKDKKFDKYIILESDHFKSGFVGLIANKISEEFILPTIVLSESETNFKASCRSNIVSINFLDLIKRLDPYLINGGGHKEACGFSFKKDNKEKILKEIDLFFKDINLEKEKAFYEEEIEFSEFDEKILINYLYKMEPFGMKNSAPILKIKNIPIDKITEFRFLKDKHLLMKIGKKFSMFHFFLSNKEKFQYKEKIKDNKENITIVLELFSKGWKLEGYIHSFE